MSGPQPGLATVVPPLPHGGLSAGRIWPPELGRRILRGLPDTAVIRRDDLVARQGTAEGSGTSDLIVLQRGDWCLKTSARRRFADYEEARAAALVLARQKRRLGALLPGDSVLALVEDGACTRLWTVSPWLRTLRAELVGAVEASDRAVLTVALCAFARAALAALQLAARSGLLLDVHPSNFARRSDGAGDAVYLDDDIGTGWCLPAAAHAVLQRVEEYAAFPDAVAAYVECFAAGVETELTARDVRLLDLRAMFEAAPGRSALGESAKGRVLRSLWRCR